MIDKIIIKFLSWVDNKLSILDFNFPKSKKKNKNVKSPDNRMDFPIE
tara:strand:+ start:1325 stop:1465 length:141 start_codon:yes stop_codon:yes gene_type:complete